MGTPKQKNATKILKFPLPVEPVDAPAESAGRKPDPVDVYVGSRVRYRRMIIGMSQVTLGDELNLTFQQIQKYEKGDNRIGASRLYQLSQILEVPVGYFFEDYISDAIQKDGGVDDGTEKLLFSFLNSREGLDLNRAFAKIHDPKVRRHLINLARALSGENADVE